MRTPARLAVVTALTILLLVGFGAPLAAQSQDDQTAASERLEWYADHVRNAEESRFRNLPWQFVGPTNVSGRMTDVEVVGPKGDNYTIYVAGASGGLWRTENEGTTWQPIFEHGASTTIGDVTLAPSDQNIVWIGTGEANIFRSSMAGAGVYKSTDGGDTWTHMGLEETHTIPRTVIHPTNPDVLYVAASGNEWTDNPERGIYKTTDGGQTWEHIFYRDERTGVIDLVMDPRAPDTLYAATWQRIRKKWNDPRNEDGYDGSGVFKSTDGGATWNPINNGLPEGQHRGRIGLDVARSNPDVVYAFIDSYETAREPDPDDTDAYGRPAGPVIRGATVYRSDDGGENWRRTSQYNDYMLSLGGTYGWVFGQIRVDPNDEDRIYVMGLRLNVSDDAGENFRSLDGMHVDHHGLWIDPENSDYLVNVNDGGLAISYDGGDEWRTFYDSLPLVQFFNIAVDTGDPMYAYGSIQDHGSRRGMIDLSRGRHNIPAVEWENAPGGEGSTHVVDPTDPNTLYAAGFYGSIFRADLETGERTQLMPRAAEGEVPYRGQWIAPFIVSPHNPRVVYLGLNKIFRSMDRGEDFEAISEDLTYNDVDQIGDIQYQTIYSITESPFEFGRLYAGTDDGRVWSSDPAGAWSEITGELPQGKVISELVASKWDPDTLFAAQNGKRDDDFTPYLWKSTDRGGTWIDLASALPSGPINVIKEDPKNPNVLYVGTDYGAYVSIDNGETWEALSHGMPTTFVHDITISEETDILVAGTHGRGVYALDVRPIQGLTDEVVAAGRHMFEPESVQMPRGRFAFFQGGGSTAGLHVWMASDGDYTVTVADASGETVHTFTGAGSEGHNFIEWNLQVEGESRTVFGFEVPPMASPGDYNVTIDANGASASAPLTLVR